MSCHNPPMIEPLHRRLAVLVTAAAILLAACGSAPASPSPTPVVITPAPSVAATPEASAGASAGASAAPSASQDADAIYDEIEGQVEQIRGLQATQKVDRETIDEATLRTMLAEQYDKDNPADYQAANETLYKALGLIPEDSSLKEMSLELLGSGVAGFYDDDQKKMFVVSRSGGIGGAEKITYAHEFTHALQDQHFTVFKDQKDVRDQSDWFLARQGVFEGDATVLMALWAFQHLSADELAQGTAADPEAQATMDKMPAILRESLLYPYTTGALFVQQAQMTGGWKGVDALYGRMPESTEQIMHPEKYAAKEAPIDVQLPKDLAKKLGTGWSVPLFDTFGEFQTGIWLREGGVPVADANTAAAGWGGDRLAVIHGPDDTWAVAMKTAWDTKEDAAEFEAAASTAIKKATGVAQVLPGAGGTTRWVVIGSDDKTLSKVANVLGLAG
jgi:hypothetical protein